MKDEYYERIMEVLRGKPGDTNPDRSEDDVTVKASPAMVAVFKALQADSRDVTVECPPEMSKHLDQIQEYCEHNRAKRNSQKDGKSIPS